MGIDRLDFEGPGAKLLREGLLKKRDKLVPPEEKQEKAASKARASSQAKSRAASGRRGQFGKRESILGSSGNTSARKTLGGQ